MKNNILMSTIMPHPPIIIPEVGGHELQNAEKTVNAMKELTAEIVEANPDTVVIITPHSIINPYYFTVYTGEKLHGNFMKFGAPEASLEVANDMEFVDELDRNCQVNFRGLSYLPSATRLDHGSAVPLYYLKQAGYSKKAVVINYTALNKKDHFLFGQKIAETAKHLAKKIVFIASGDLSHKLKPEAPAGFSYDAHLFDDLVVECIKAGDYKSIQEITPEMRELAGECGYNSLMVALGLMDGKPINNQVLSYEAPFGVGYVVAKL